MILVTGATGNVGGELVHQLAANGQSVRALIRETSRAGLPDRMEMAIGDLNEPDSLAQALNGVRGVFLKPFDRRTKSGFWPTCWGGIFMSKPNPTRRHGKR